MARKKVPARSATIIQVDSLPVIEVDRAKVDTTSIKNPRVTPRSEEDYARLKNSILTKGVNQTPGVWKRDPETIKAIKDGLLPGNPDAEYDVIWGWGRWGITEEIHKETNGARFSTMRVAVVDNCARGPLLTFSWSENHDRTDTSPTDDYNLIKAHLAQGKTQEEVAEELGITRNDVSQLVAFFENAAKPLIRLVILGIVGFRPALATFYKLGGSSATAQQLEKQEQIALKIQHEFEEEMNAESETPAQSEAEESNAEEVQEGAKDEKPALDPDLEEVKEEKKDAPKKRGPKKSIESVKKEQQKKVKSAKVQRTRKLGNKMLEEAERAAFGNLKPKNGRMKAQGQMPWSEDQMRDMTAICAKVNPPGEYGLNTYLRGVFETLQALQRLTDPGLFYNQIVEQQRKKANPAVSNFASAVARAKQEQAEKDAQKDKVENTILV